MNNFDVLSDGNLVPLPFASLSLGIENPKKMIQLITTHNELQEVLDAAVQKAYSSLPVAESNRIADEIIDGKELIRRLDISEPTLIRWRKKGKIPYIQLGATIRYRYQAVLEALEVKRKGGKK